MFAELQYCLSTLHIFSYLILLPCERNAIIAFTDEGIRAQNS